MGATGALTGAAAGLDILSGLLGMSAAESENRALKHRAELMRLESEADIARYKDETRAFKAEQSVRYLKSGVALEGSPLEILDETARVSAENISAMRARSDAEQRALKAKGEGARISSRMAFAASLGKAVDRTAAVGTKMGWWDKKTPTTTTTTRADITGFKPMRGTDDYGSRT
jgi:hypothetical protein